MRITRRYECSLYIRGGRGMDDNQVVAALLLDDGCHICQSPTPIHESTRRHLQSMHSSCLQALQGGTTAARTPPRPMANARIDEALMILLFQTCLKNVGGELASNKIQKRMNERMSETAPESERRSAKEQKTTLLHGAQPGTAHRYIPRGISRWSVDQLQRNFPC